MLLLCHSLIFFVNYCYYLFQFKCTICPKSYKSKSTLKRHMKNHLGALLCCKYCTGKFVSNENLVKHLQKFHSSDQLQECRFCNLTSKKSAKAMKTHEIKYHYKQWLALEKKKINRLEENSDYSE